MVRKRKLRKHGLLGNRRKKNSIEAKKDTQVLEAAVPNGLKEINPELKNEMIKENEVVTPELEMANTETLKKKPVAKKKRTTKKKTTKKRRTRRRSSSSEE